VSRQVCLELTDLVRQVRMAWRVVELRAAALADADGDLDDDLAVSLEMALLGILRTADRLDLLFLGDDDADEVTAQRGER
jgi:hypothetical protein